MLQDGELSYEKVAEYSGLTLEQVLEIKEKYFLINVAYNKGGG